MLNALILAGGVGKRFWPKSTSIKPKQFQKIIGNKTMIQQTFERISRLVPEERIFVIVAKEHQTIVSEQLELSKSNILVEPKGRNTAAAIALGIRNLNSNDVAIALPSDHYIPDIDRFIFTLRTATSFAANKPVIVTLGIKPTRPETGYGYIEVDPEHLKTMGGTIASSPIPVKRFHEKPDLETAKSYLASGNFFWNSGIFIFIFRVDTMWNAFEKYMPRLYELFKSSRTIEEVYDLLEPVSIDYGVMEKAQNIYMIPANFTWSDVGSWDAVYELGQKDENGNHSQARVAIFKNSKNCAVFAEGKRVVVANLEDVIVVAENNDILVIRRGTTQDVKDIELPNTSG
ncbi:MAG: mannose-phosphate guanylyltransferase [Thermotogota bacterium]|nr:mannose-phosphate guanylyltransferase [Thermotogota bacterium]